MKSALKYENSDKPGSYLLAIRANRSVFNPGESFTLEQYITGYGKGTSLKIAHYPSSDIFDYDNSFVEWNLKPANSENMQVWGAQKNKLEPIGITLFHGDFESRDWADSSAFVDFFPHDKTTMLISEKNLGGNSPYQYTFKLRKDAPAGVHKLHFYMTYFNGESWQCSASEVEFRINNSFEKNNSLLSSLAFLALVITISKDGLGPVIETIRNTYTTFMPVLIKYFS